MLRYAGSWDWVCTAALCVTLWFVEDVLHLVHFTRISDSSVEPSTTSHSAPVPALFTAGITILTIAGKLGDALAPTLVSGWPLTLLALNSNDLHCGLTSTTVNLGPWFTVSMLRRLAEDPLFFSVGWYYRDSLLHWVRQWSHSTAEGFTQAEAYFRRASYAAVMIDPGAVVYALAGAARMSPWIFFTLNVTGTSVRLLLIRGLGVLFLEQLRLLLEMVQNYQFHILVITTLITLIGAWRLTKPVLASA